MTNSFDHLLRKALEAPAPPDGGCLDADTLAAWSEGTLDQAGRATAETHASVCSRCQAVVAAMIRTEPVGRITRPWWRSPAFGWLAPLTVAAAVLVIWVRVDPPQSNQDAMVAAVPAPREPAASVAPGTTTGKSREGQPSDLAAARRAAPPPLPPPQPAIVPMRDRSSADEGRSHAPLPAGELARQETVTTATPPGSSQAGAPQAVAAPVASSPADPRRGASSAEAPPAPVAPLPRPAAPPASSASAVVTAGAPRVDAAAERRLAESFPSNVVRKLAGVQGEVLVETADRTSRWRVTTPGVVMRSSDGGVTWQSQATGDARVVTAGAAPSDAVCWLVGRGGMVLLSTDGRSWRRVPFPEPVDLVSVTASDGATATITAAGGRTFSTADGGVTWR